ncbi:MAG: hypothetical protein PHI59_08600 [Candidatus Omnitrophica bacterium]|nr:hypothetical protein [Candidatus Omnitrophota bacterium]
MKKFFIVLSGVYLLLLGLVIAGFLALMFIALTNAPASSANVPEAAIGLKFMMLSGVPAAIWLIVTGIGIIMVKNWARYSLFVMSGLSILFILPSLLIMPLTLILRPGLQEGAGLFAILLMMAIEAVVGIAIPVFFFIFFNRKSVRDLFVPQGVERKKSRVPLGVKIIAIFAFMGAFFLFLAPFIFMSIMPKMRVLGSIHLSGAQLQAYFLIFAFVNLFIAIGLFRLNKWAWWTYVIFTVLSMILCLVNTITMDETAIKDMMPPNMSADTVVFPVLFYKITGFISLILPAVFLAYMISKRRIFIPKE